jgi:hypothetical protein
VPEIVGADFLEADSVERALPLKLRRFGTVRGASDCTVVFLHLAFAVAGMAFSQRPED